MKTNTLKILLAAACIPVLLTGCTTVTIYEDPVSKFQTAVNSANDAIRPYLLGVTYSLGDLC